MGGGVAPGAVVGAPVGGAREGAGWHRRPHTRGRYPGAVPLGQRHGPRLVVGCRRLERCEGPWLPQVRELLVLLVLLVLLMLLVLLVLLVLLPPLRPVPMLLQLRRRLRSRW